MFWVMWSLDFMIGWKKETHLGKFGLPLLVLTDALHNLEMCLIKIKLDY